MVWANIIIVLIILLYAWDGFRRGFLQETFDLLTVVAALFLALKFYSWAGSLFQNWGLSPELSKAVGFLVLWIVFQAIFRLFTWLIFKLVPEKWEINRINRFFGVLPGAAKGLLIMSIVLMLFVIWPISAQAKDTLVQYPVSGFLIRSALRLENQMYKIFGPLNNLALFSTVPQDHKMTKLNFHLDKYVVDQKGEEQMLLLVNADRMKAGLSPLVMDQTIREAARSHSIDMVKNGYFSHYDLSGKTPADRLTNFQVNFNMAGENIALAPTVDLAETGFMNSPDHRDNILTPDFTRVGIGIIDTGSYGRMVTQNFTN